MRHCERPARGPAADEGVRPTGCAVGPQGSSLEELHVRPLRLRIVAIRMVQVVS